MRKKFHYQRGNKKRLGNNMINFTSNDYIISVPKENILVKTIVCEALLKNEIGKEEEIQQIVELLQMCLKN